MTYTEQAELDDMGLAARWACTFTGPINAGEHTAKRKAAEKELSLIIGRAFRIRAALMCNYKDHDAFYPPYPDDLQGWDENANPEMHYFVKQWLALVYIVEASMDISIDVTRYETGIVKVYTNAKKTKTGNHYIIRADSSQEIDPDPSLVRVEGTHIKWRPLVA